MTTLTAAQRARARRDPALASPPARPKGSRTSSVQNLHLRVRGRTYPIGANIDGGTPWEMPIDGTATLTLPIRSPDASLEDALSDEAQLQNDGATVTVDGIVYVVNAVSADNGLYTLTLEDQVAWRLRRFSRFLAVSRKKTTRAGFIKRLVDEASKSPLAPMRAFIPELHDKQRIAKAQGDAGRDSGLGEGSDITVKGHRATAKQRTTIDEALGEAKDLKASRRVMIAAVMAMTQESVAGEKPKNGEHLGPYHQANAWGPSADRKDPAKATRLFLTGGKGGQPGWKQAHGGVKHAPGDLAAAIEKIQRSGKPREYARWKDEATKTVDAWLGSDDGFGGGGSSTYAKRYDFTRGERGGTREDSWEASGRLAEEVNVKRWAAANTLFYASEEELRAGAPSVTIRGGEPFVLAEPSWEWGANRPVAEITLQIAIDRWGALPGAVVLIKRDSAIDGRWLVKNVSGERLDSPVATVVLARPTRPKLEPSHETGTRDTESGRITTDGGARGIVEAAVKIAKDAGGTTVYVGSDYRPGSHTTSGNVSDHSQNNKTRAARDIGKRGVDLLTGPPSKELDKAVVAIGDAFGRKFGRGNREIIDTFRWHGYQVQIIWRTPKYGGHMGHIHIGAHKV